MCAQTAEIVRVAFAPLARHVWSRDFWEKNGMNWAHAYSSTGMASGWPSDASRCHKTLPGVPQMLPRCLQMSPSSPLSCVASQMPRPDSGVHFDFSTKKSIRNEHRNICNFRFPIEAQLMSKVAKNVNIMIQIHTRKTKKTTKKTARKCYELGSPRTSKSSVLL